jgi:hypothetical protein
MAPFALGFGEQFVRGRDNSVGAMFVPLILAALFAVALIGAFLFAAGIRRLKPERRVKVMLGIAVAIIAPAGIYFLWWSHANIERVRTSAEQIAGNEPYCIEVASGEQRRPATSPSDFSGYNMRAPHADGAYWGRHAVLAVGAGNSPDVYHWSYTNKAFIAEAYGAPPIYCQPRRHFATAFTDTPPTDRQSIRIAGMRLSIPLRYRPHLQGMTLVFSATAPDFTNVPEVGSQQAIESMIEVSLVDSDRTDAWRGSGTLVEDAGEEHGLRVQTRWSVGPDGQEKTSPPTFEYYNLSSDNRVATVISCIDKVKWQCMHAFRSGGWTYTFHHSPTDLSQWKTMQDRLVELARSFVQAPAQ